MRSAAATTRTSAHELRTLVAELTPPTVYEVGLAPALEELVASLDSAGTVHAELEVQRGFWMGVAEGLSVIDAGLACGVSRPTAQRLFARSGGVMPSLRNPRKPPTQGGRLTLAEREEILLALEELAAWSRDLVVVGVGA